jgi:hypothetical protein
MQLLHCIFSKFLFLNVLGSGGFFFFFFIRKTCSNNFVVVLRFLLQAFLVQVRVRDFMLSFYFLFFTNNMIIFAGFFRANVSHPVHSPI